MCLLERLLPDELTELRDLYRRDWPKNAFTFYTLENFVRWRPWFVGDEVQLYIDRRHNWRLSGTFVAKDHNDIFFDTLLETNHGLLEMLSGIVQFCGPKLSVVCSPRFHDTLLTITNTSSYRKTSDDTMVCYRQSVTRESAPTSDLSVGFRCCPLRYDDIDCVTDQWVHNEPMFVNLPGRLIARNPSLGVYDEKGQLVSWCLMRGLGRAIIDRFSKQLRKGGILPQALIVESNTASRSLFEGLGFTEVDRWFWAKFDR